MFCGCPLLLCEFWGWLDKIEGASNWEDSTKKN